MFRLGPHGPDGKRARDFPSDGPHLARSRRPCQLQKRGQLTQCPTMTGLIKQLSEKSAYIGGLITIGPCRRPPLRLQIQPLLCARIVYGYLLRGFTAVNAGVSLRLKLPLEASRRPFAHAHGSRAGPIIRRPSHQVRQALRVAWRLPCHLEFSKSVMIPSAQELGPPANPERFNSPQSGLPRRGSRGACSHANQGRTTARQHLVRLRCWTPDTRLRDPKSSLRRRAIPASRPGDEEGFR